MKRHIQIDDWVFEVTQVIARKAPDFGQPYTSIVTLNLIDSTSHMVGMLDKEIENFSRSDGKTFVKFAQLMAIKNIDYSRYHFGHKRKVSLKL